MQMRTLLALPAIIPSSVALDGVVKTWPYMHPLFIPTWLVVLSVTVVAVQLVSRGRDLITDPRHIAYATRRNRALDVTRFFLCAVLLSINIFTLETRCGEHRVEIGLCIFFVYMTLLSLIRVTKGGISSFLAPHIVLLPLATFGIYFQRDIWPLATYASTPLDESMGWIIWLRVGILGVVGVIIPLATPRTYIPADLSSPGEPVAEQTASPLSFITYSFIGSIVAHAYKHPHLPYDDLPPLADYDRSRYLTEQSFPLLDPTRQTKRRHLLWGLLSYFRTDYIVMAIMLTIRICMTYASPIAVNRLLHYIETHGTDASVKPWVWVIAMGLAPLMAAISWETYIFFGQHVAARTEAILTQLIFEHALRIRLNDNAPSSDFDTLSTTKKKNQKDSNLVGRIQNLQSTDLASVKQGRDFLLLVLMGPVGLTLTTIFLYVLLGWSAFVGMAVTILGLPIPGKITLLIRKAQAERLRRTDERVQTVVETVSVLRMIKSFAWESRTADRLSSKREAELAWLKKQMLLGLLSTIANYILPVVSLVSIYGIYTLVMKRELTAATLWMLSRNIPLFTQCKLSLDRIDDFLHDTELLDQHANAAESTLVTQLNMSQASAAFDYQNIGFHNTVFTWSEGTPTSESNSPSLAQRSFRLMIPDTILFKQGSINLVVGPTGSGKTSLLLALLGEMHYVGGVHSGDSWFNLPRKGGVAYAAQEPWIQNDTIKENILLGSSFDEDRYKKVIHQCALEKDLGLFSAGDNTEVGEKGLTLSGGQKARISLARALYSMANIVLLDDILSALDVHTAKWIVDNCLTGDLFHDRTVILITHNIALAGPIARRLVSISSNGTISVQDTLDKALEQVAELRMEMEKTKINIEVEVEEKVDNKVEPSKGDKSNGKLIANEEIALGYVSRNALKLYTSSTGGISFWTFFLMIGLASEALSVFQTWFLGYWASQYKDQPASEVRVPIYLGLYLGLVSITLLLTSVSYAIFVFGSLRASRRIHQKLVASILGTTLHFLDRTPMGRIVSRFTQDISSVDGLLSTEVSDLTKQTIGILTKFATICMFTPLFLPAGCVYAVIIACIAHVYNHAQLSVKRELSNARSPLFSHFSAAIHGLVSIRAYGIEDTFKAESLRRIDYYTRPSRIFVNLNRWITIRVDALAGLFSSGLAGYLLYRGNNNAGDIGLQLNLAIAFPGMILMWVRTANMLEAECNSLERIHGYITIEQEPKPSASHQAPAAWPTSGALSFTGLSARYSEDGPNVLHNLTFEVQSGEKVGIVGRTGSGKSSLTMSLLRLIPTDGKVTYDGLPTNDLNLDDLRGNITIIPQQPELLSGTIRQNLDPYKEHEDAVLNDALRATGLFKLQQDLPDNEQITLDSTVGSGGSGYSVGQRQIIALARALVRRSKVLILDEATASLDHHTDAHIQASLEREFRDSTLLIIAHRLRTIVDADKVLVLDAGRIVEYDSPSALLAKDDGHFKKMVDESGDKDLFQAKAS